MVRVLHDPSLPPDDELVVLNAGSLTCSARASLVAIAPQPVYRGPMPTCPSCGRSESREPQKGQNAAAVSLSRPQFGHVGMSQR